MRRQSTHLRKLGYAPSPMLISTQHWLLRRTVFLVDNSPRTWTDICRKSGVSRTTLAKWGCKNRAGRVLPLRQRTRVTYVTTVEAVLRVLGRKLEIVSTR
jgi:hypothetical protein